MEGTTGWKARPDGRHARMEGTSGWKARPDGRPRPNGTHYRHCRQIQDESTLVMEVPPRKKGAHLDGRHTQMEGTPGWKARPDGRHAALTTSNAPMLGMDDCTRRAIKEGQT
ncbi:hypothetical protein Tco_0408542 [Tanacetum coccineum]